MPKSDWIEEQNTSESIVWRNRQKNNITIEAYIFDDEPLDKPTWYVYGAVDRKGVPSSPAMVEGKADAIKIIASLKKSYKSNGTRGFGR